MAGRMFTSAELIALPSRRYAERGDTCIGASGGSDWDRSSDAIGGAYGISWYEVFEDGQGNCFKVYCVDGERGGKGPYRD
jgi:hypothetical protein